MPIRIQNTKITVDALVDESFKGLSAKDREKVMTALVKANPILKDRTRVDPGTIITIPIVEGVTAKPQPSREGHEDPVGDGREVVARAVAAYGAHLSQRYEVYQSQLAEQGALLKDSDFKKALRERPDAAELVPQIDAAIKARSKEAAAIGKEAQDAVKKLTNTLDSM